MDEAPPPTEHVLRPHHLVLLSVLMIAFKDLEVKKLPTAFALHLNRILLNEIAEVTQPKSHRELMKEISQGPCAESKECAQFLAAVRTVHADIYSTEKLGNFLDLPALFVEKVVEENPRFMRRSIFGYFCRRCFVSYVKLSYGGLSQLREDYQAWCSGSLTAGYGPVPKGDLSLDYLLHKTQSDKKEWAKADTFAAWEKGKAVGDESMAMENIRRFFEQHFHDQTDSGFRQHALLNVVHMHYINKEFVAARKLLGEAITVARTANDRLTLQHCLSLLHRLPPPPGSKPFINEIQPEMHPLEVLYDVHKLMDEENEQPLSTAFIKIIQAMGLYDHWLDSQCAVPNDDHQWAQHAVQSVVWREAGCERLASIAENIVIAFTDIGSDNTNRLVVLMNKAYRIARQGRYNEALTLLLEPVTWKGLSITDYGSWAHEIWNILALRAVRRGQDRHYREYLLPRRPQGPWNPRYYLFEQQTDEPFPPIRQSLHKVLHLKQHDQIASAVHDLLNALWQAEFLGRYGAYRTGIILMADFGLEFGMPKRSKRILEEILPQLISGDDLEQRAVACFTLARCVLAADDPLPEVLQKALEYLKVAEKDFASLEIYRSLQDVLYLQAVLFENLGLTIERDDTIKRYEETERTAKALGEIAVDFEVRQIFEVIAMVGTALADR